MAIERMLIVAYQVGADAQAASIHIDDRLPEIAGRGIEFEILSSVCGSRHGDRRHYRVVSALFADQFREAYDAWRRAEPKLGPKALGLALLALLLLPLYVVEKNALPMQRGWSWSLPAALLGWWRCRKFRPEVIYATDSNPAVHLAALWMSRLAGVPFVSEFHDPMASLPKPRKKLQRRFAGWVERKAVEKARRAVFLTESAARSARGRHSGHAGKIKSVYPGFAKIRAMGAQDAAGGPASPGKRIIAHFGNLNGSRNIDPLTRAVQACRPSGVEIHLYGYLSGHVRDSIADCGHPELFRAFGKVPRTVALARMQEADVLLLVQHAGAVSSETIPSKVHEYLQTGKPILAYTYENAELDGLLRRYGHFPANRANEQDCVELTRRILRGEYAAEDVRDYPYGLRESVDALLLELEGRPA